MQRFATIAATAALTALAGCGSISDRPTGSGVPTNPFASNYPSANPDARVLRRDGGGERRRATAEPRPPAGLPD